jgi:hypothetical protein
MNEPDINRFARQTGQYPPPQREAGSKPISEDTAADTEQSPTWSDRLDDLIVKSGDVVVGLLLFLLKLVGLALLFWGAFALYPEDFFSTPFAQMTFGKILAIFGSVSLGLIGTWILVAWLNKSSDI